MSYADQCPQGNRKFKKKNKKHKQIKYHRLLLFLIVSECFLLHYLFFICGKNCSPHTTHSILVVGFSSEIFLFFANTHRSSPLSLAQRYAYESQWTCFFDMSKTEEILFFHISHSYSPTDSYFLYLIVLKSRVFHASLSPNISTTGSDRTQKRKSGRQGSRERVHGTFLK